MDDSLDEQYDYRQNSQGLMDSI